MLRDMRSKQTRNKAGGLLGNECNLTKFSQDRNEDELRCEQ